MDLSKFSLGYGENQMIKLSRLDVMLLLILFLNIWMVYDKLIEKGLL